ncbi:MAG: VOC family protein [Nocardioidaceae bacterium]
MSGSLPHNITFDCADPFELARFWSQVVGMPIGDDDNPGDPAATVAMQTGPGLLFIRVPEGKTVKNRTHLDLQPTDRSRDDEVERLIGIGARLHEDHRRPEQGGAGWVTLLDPEGNEFCIERGPVDRSS